MTDQRIQDIRDRRAAYQRLKDGQFGGETAIGATGHFMIHAPDDIDYLLKQLEKYQQVEAAARQLLATPLFTMTAKPIAIVDELGAALKALDGAA